MPFPSHSDVKVFLAHGKDKVSQQKEPSTALFLLPNLSQSMTIRIYETEEKHSHMNEYCHLTLFEMCEGGSQKKASFTGHELAYMNLTQQSYCQQ
jgi:hypothetical protein